VVLPPDRPPRSDVLPYRGEPPGNGSFADQAAQVVGRSLGASRPVQITNPFKFLDFLSNESAEFEKQTGRPSPIRQAAEAAKLQMGPPPVTARPQPSPPGIEGPPQRPESDFARGSGIDPLAEQQLRQRLGMTGWRPYVAGLRPTSYGEPVNKFLERGHEGYVSPEQINWAASRLPSTDPLNRFSERLVGVPYTRHDPFLQGYELFRRAMQAPSVQEALSRQTTLENLAINLGIAQLGPAIGQGIRALGAGRALWPGVRPTLNFAAGIPTPMLGARAPFLARVGAEAGLGATGEVAGRKVAEALPENTPGWVRGGASLAAGIGATVAAGGLGMQVLPRKWMLEPGQLTYEEYSRFLVRDEAREKIRQEVMRSQAVGDRDTFVFTVSHDPATAADVIRNGAPLNQSVYSQDVMRTGAPSSSMYEAVGGITRHGQIVYIHVWRKADLAGVHPDKDYALKGIDPGARHKPLETFVLEEVDLLRSAVYSPVSRQQFAQAISLIYGTSGITVPPNALALAPADEAASATPPPGAPPPPGGGPPTPPGPGISTDLIGIPPDVLSPTQMPARRAYRPSQLPDDLPPQREYAREGSIAMQMPWVRAVEGARRRIAATPPRRHWRASIRPRPGHVYRTLSAPSLELTLQTGVIQNQHAMRTPKYENVLEFSYGPNLTASDDVNFGWGAHSQQQGGRGYAIGMVVEVPQIKLTGESTADAEAMAHGGVDFERDTESGTTVIFYHDGTTKEIDWNDPAVANKYAIRQNSELQDRIRQAHESGADYYANPLREEHPDALGRRLYGGGDDPEDLAERAALTSSDDSPDPVWDQSWNAAVIHDQPVPLSLVSRAWIFEIRDGGGKGWNNEYQITEVPPEDLQAIIKADESRRASQAGGAPSQQAIDASRREALEADYRAEQKYEEGAPPPQLPTQQQQLLQKSMLRESIRQDAVRFLQSGQNRLYRGRTQYEDPITGDLKLTEAPDPADPSTEPWKDPMSVSVETRKRTPERYVFYVTEGMNADFVRRGVDFNQEIDRLALLSNKSRRILAEARMTDIRQAVPLSRFEGRNQGPRPDLPSLAQTQRLLRRHYYLDDPREQVFEDGYDIGNYVDFRVREIRSKNPQAQIVVHVFRERDLKIDDLIEDMIDRTTETLANQRMKWPRPAEKFPDVGPVYPVASFTPEELNVPPLSGDYSFRGQQQLWQSNRLVSPKGLPPSKEEALTREGIFSAYGMGLPGSPPPVATKKGHLPAYDPKEILSPTRFPRVDWKSFLRLAPPAHRGYLYLATTMDRFYQMMIEGKLDPHAPAWRFGEGGSLLQYELHGINIKDVQKEAADKYAARPGIRRTPEAVDLERAWAAERLKASKPDDPSLLPMLRGHLPEEMVVRVETTWPGGAGEKRTYFNRSVTNALEFLSGEARRHPAGNVVIIRIKDSGPVGGLYAESAQPHTIQQVGKGITQTDISKNDVFTTQSISGDRLEYYANDGKWYPLRSPSPQAATGLSAQSSPQKTRVPWAGPQGTYPNVPSYAQSPTKDVMREAISKMPWLLKRGTLKGLDDQQIINVVGTLTHGQQLDLNREALGAPHPDLFQNQPFEPYDPNLTPQQRQELQDRIAFWRIIQLLDREGGVPAKIDPRLISAGGSDFWEDPNVSPTIGGIQGERDLLGNKTFPLDPAFRKTPRYGVGSPLETFPPQRLSTERYRPPGAPSPARALFAPYTSPPGFIHDRKTLEEALQGAFDETSPEQIKRIADVTWARATWWARRNGSTTERYFKRHLSQISNDPVGSTGRRILYDISGIKIPETRADFLEELKKLREKGVNNAGVAGPAGMGPITANDYLKYWDWIIEEQDIISTDADRSSLLAFLAREDLTGSIESTDTTIPASSPSRFAGQVIPKKNLQIQDRLLNNSPSHDPNEKNGLELRKEIFAKFLQKQAAVNHPFSLNLIQALGGKGTPLGPWKPSDGSLDMAAALLGAPWGNIRLRPIGQAAGVTEFYRSGSAVVVALGGRDFPTAMHELAHVFLNDLANSPAEQHLFRRLHTWATRTTGGRWTHVSDEQFVRGFMQYLREGIAPEPGLDAAFAAFREWLRDLNNAILQTDRQAGAPGGWSPVSKGKTTLTTYEPDGSTIITPGDIEGGLDTMPINPEIRALFDEMFGGPYQRGAWSDDSAVRATLQGRSLYPFLPASRPEPASADFTEAEKLYAKAQRVVNYLLTPPWPGQRPILPYLYTRSPEAPRTYLMQKVHENILAGHQWPYLQDIPWMHWADDAVANVAIGRTETDPRPRPMLQDVLGGINYTTPPPSIEPSYGPARARVQPGVQRSLASTTPAATPVEEHPLVQDPAGPDVGLQPDASPAPVGPPPNPPPPRQPGHPVGSGAGGPQQPPLTPHTGLSADMNVPSYEKPMITGMRLWEGARNHRSLEIEGWHKSGMRLLRQQGFNPDNLDEATMRPLFEALHGERDPLGLSPQLKLIYDDIIARRDRVEQETKDFLKMVPSFPTAEAAVTFDTELLLQRMDRIESYFPRFWNEKNIAVGRRSGIPPKFNSVQERAKASFVEMLEHGFEPKSWNPYTMMAFREITGVEYMEAVTLVTRLGQTKQKYKIGDNYYPLVIPASEIVSEDLKRRYRVPRVGAFFEGRPYLDKNGTLQYSEPKFVPKELAERLEMAFGRLPTWGQWNDINFGRIVSAWGSAAKEAKLFASGFQDVDFAVRALGTSFAPSTILSGRAHNIVPFIYRLLGSRFSASMREEIRAKIMSDKPIYKDFDITLADVVRNGWSVQGDLSLLRRTGLEFMDTLNARPGLTGKAQRAFQVARRFMSEGLFEGTYRVAQVHALENFIIPWIRRQHPDWTRDQVAALAAREVNTMFSTPGRWQTVFSDPFFAEGFRTVLFSTAENESLFKQAIGTVNGPSKALWVQYWIGLYLGIAFVANLINLAGEGKPLPADRYNPVTLNDPEALWGSAGYNSKFLSPVLPFLKARDGGRVYLDLVGQMDTVFRWALDPKSAWSARWNVLPRAVINQSAGRTFTDEPLDTPAKRVTQGLMDVAAPIGATSAIGALRSALPKQLGNIIPEGEARLGVAGQLGQVTGLNLRSDTTPELLNRLAKQNGAKGWEQLTTLQQNQILAANPGVKRELAARQQAALNKGTKGAKYVAAMQGVNDLRLKQEASLVHEIAKEWSQGNIDLEKAYYSFRDRFFEIQGESAARRSTINETYGRVVGKRPGNDDPNEQALWDYYDLLRKSTKDSGMWDKEKYDAGYSKLWYSWSFEQKMWVGGNTGLTGHPAVVEKFMALKPQDLYQIRELLMPYIKGPPEITPDLQSPTKSKAKPTPVPAGAR